MATHCKNDIEQFLADYHETEELIPGENYPFLIQSYTMSSTGDL